jgi:hypothetical protein
MDTSTVKGTENADNFISKSELSTLIPIFQGIRMEKSTASVQSSESFTRSLTNLRFLSTIMGRLIYESKLNVNIPDSHVSHPKYKCYRRDRDYLISPGLDKNGGGIIIYIRKEYMHSVQKSESMEVMHLNLILKNNTFNFLACYKSPRQHNQLFVDYLDSIITGIDLKDPLFIIGDLNMDLLSPNPHPLKEFITLNSFNNFITEPTRIRNRFFKASNDEASSSTLIDVLIHNKDLV